MAMTEVQDVLGMDEGEYITATTENVLEVLDILFKSENKVEAAKKLLEWINDGDSEMKALAVVNLIDVFVGFDRALTGGTVYNAVLAGLKLAHVIYGSR